MQYIFEVNSRTTLEESAKIKHLKVINNLKQIAAPWGLNDVDVPFPGFGNDSHIAQIVLDNRIAKGVKYSIFYRYRNLLDNDSSGDDRIYLEFNPKKFDFGFLIGQILPEYVKIFDAYRAAFFDKELIYVDFDRSRFANLRLSILRFYPICFFDRELCNRALNLQPEDIVRKLTGKIEHISVFNDGIFFNDNSKFFTTEEANIFNLKVTELLTI